MPPSASTPSSFRTTLKAEEVVVVGKAPTVDVGSSSNGDEHQFGLHPEHPQIAAPGGKGLGQRSFEAVAEAPRRGQGGHAWNVDQRRPTSPENQYVIDGLSVEQPALGIIGTPLFDGVRRRE